MLYTAVYRDEGILSEPRIEDVLAIVADTLGAPEDCAIWYGPRVVCVVHGPDRRITWLDAGHKPAAAAAA